MHPKNMEIGGNRRAKRAEIFFGCFRLKSEKISGWFLRPVSVFTPGRKKPRSYTYICYIFFVRTKRTFVQKEHPAGPPKSRDFPGVPGPKPIFSPRRLRRRDFSKIPWGKPLFFAVGALRAPELGGLVLFSPGIS